MKKKWRIMARKKLSKRAKGKKLATEIEALGERYLKLHKKLQSMLKRKYVRTNELYEESPEDIERIIRVMAKRFRMGVGLPKTRKGLLTRLRSLTRKSVASIKQQVVAQQREDYLNALRNMGDNPQLIDSLVQEIDRIGWNKFFKSSFYIPITNVGSPRLARYLSTFGESPTLTRMREFIEASDKGKEEKEAIGSGGEDEQ
jgi:hypothetical protein